MLLSFLEFEGICRYNPSFLSVCVSIKVVTTVHKDECTLWKSDKLYFEVVYRYVAILHNAKYFYLLYVYLPGTYIARRRAIITTAR